MISTELYALSDQLLEHAARNEATPPERMARFASLLFDLSARVAAMEDYPIPEAARQPLPTEQEVVDMLVDKGWSRDEARAFIGEDTQEKSRD